MTEELFAKFLNENGNRQFTRERDKDHYSTKDALPANLDMRLFVPYSKDVGVSFYSGVELKEHSNLYGPWLATALIDFFAAKDVAVSVCVPSRTDTKQTPKSDPDEGTVVVVRMSEIQFDESDGNDSRIKKFGITLLEFLNDTFNNDQTVKMSRLDYYNDHKAFVENYASRRQLTSEGLSADELTKQEILEKAVMTDSVMVSARGKSATGSALSESRTGTDGDESDLYLLVADFGAWGYTLKEMSTGEKQSYDVNDGNGRPRAHMRSIKEGNYLLGYQTSKSKSGTESAAIVSVLRCASASDDNKDKVEFEKVCDLERPISLDDLKKDGVLKDSKAITGNFQHSLYRFRKSEVIALAELMKANDPYIASMIIAAGGGDIGLPRNKILFGAPGTGKSFNLEEDRKNYFPDNYERVTFYPTYSYAQFVGTYKPVMKPIIGKDGKEEQDAKGDVKEDISYKFVPGPFLRVLVNALNNPAMNWCLIIEEINRANAAAVFGDVFQLLDRGSNGLSEYFVAVSEDVKKYLADNKLYVEHLKIPANMYIWATMNSADQGVFPIDTAFKRRWAFEYIGVDDEAKGNMLEWSIEGKGYNWDEVRRVINGLLAVNGVNEDKLMGPYFIQPSSKEEKVKEENEKDENEISTKAFSSKVLMYLWEDAGRMIRRNLFGDRINCYSKLVDDFKSHGMQVFAKAVKQDQLEAEIKDLLKKLSSTPPGDSSEMETTEKTNS